MWLSSLLALSLVSACASGDEFEAQPATRAALVSLARPPISLEWAELKATALCMARKGFDYPPYEVFEPAGVVTGSLGGFLSPFSVESARRSGYEGRIRTRSTREGDPDSATKAYLATLPRRKRKLYLRIRAAPGSPPVVIKLPNGAEVTAPSGGCVGEGREAVYGSVRDFLKLFYYPQQVRQFGQEALGDSATHQALAEYVKCMDDAGYQVASPTDALDAAQEKFGATHIEGRPSEAELDMAVADATCQMESRFFQVLDQVLLRIAAGWVSDHEGDLLALADLQRAASKRAKRILEDSSP